MLRAALAHDGRAGVGRCLPPASACRAGWPTPRPRARRQRGRVGLVTWRGALTARPSSFPPPPLPPGRACRTGRARRRRGRDIALPAGRCAPAVSSMGGEPTPPDPLPAMPPACQWNDSWRRQFRVRRAQRRQRPPAAVLGCVAVVVESAVVKKRRSMAVVQRLLCTTIDKVGQVSRRELVQVLKFNLLDGLCISTQQSRVCDPPRIPGSGLCNLRCCCARAPATDETTSAGSTIALLCLFREYLRS